MVAYTDQAGIYPLCNESVECDIGSSRHMKGRNGTIDGILYHCKQSAGL